MNQLKMDIQQTIGTLSRGGWARCASDDVYNLMRITKLRQQIDDLKQELAQVLGIAPAFNTL